MTPSPESHKSTAKKPDDFDAFWSGTLAETEKLPLDVSLEPLPMRSTPEVEVFEAHYSSYGGLRIAGWYARPRHPDGPLPGLLHVPGYAGEPFFPSPLADDGYAVFSAAPRGKLRSNGVFNPGYPGLLTHNIHDRDSYGYRGFYMDAVRAFDLLMQLPEVDSNRVGVMGGSQGRSPDSARGVGQGRQREGRFGRRALPVLHHGCDLIHPLVPLRGDQRLPPPLSPPA